MKKDIPIENVARYFHLPIHLAADALKVGETWLKQKCREHNIKRWPYRKVEYASSCTDNLAMLLFLFAPKLIWTCGFLVTAGQESG